MEIVMKGFEIEKQKDSRLNLHHFDSAYSCSSYG
jgi:hypothetical protein